MNLIFRMIIFILAKRKNGASNQRQYERLINTANNSEFAVMSFSANFTLIAVRHLFFDISLFGIEHSDVNGTVFVI